jgi:hypothetical protein
MQGKTSKILSINGINTFLIPEIYFQKARIFLIKKKGKEEIFQIFSHFSSLKPIFIPNKASEYIFKLNNVEILEKIIKIKINIDRIFLKEIVDDTYINYLKKYERTFKLKDIENVYLNLTNAYSILLKNKFKDVNAISNCNKEISEIYRILILYKLSNFSEIDDEGIFLPVKFDFRGRFYYESAVSPTYLKEIRLCLYYGYYSNSDIINSNIINSNIIDSDFIYKHAISDNITKMNNILNEQIRKIEQWGDIPLLGNFKKYNVCVKQSII